MNHDDLAYFASRAKQELVRANEAPDPSVAALHQRMADAYQARMDELGDLPSHETA